jgi:predicted HicB family RNase H-like nuclease
MNINGYNAIIQYDSEIDMFRGEFIGLNGGADFYASNIKNLKKEGRNSIKIFLEICKEDGINPREQHSEHFNIRKKLCIYQ